MNKVSIFELEKRFDWEKEFERIQKYIKEDSEIQTLNDYYTYYELMDELIFDFPLNESARSLEDYFWDYGYYDEDKRKQDLLFINFWIVFLKWFESEGYISPSDFDCYSSFEKFRKDISKLILNFLERANYMYLDEEFDKQNNIHHIYLVKRDVEVDSIIHIIQPELRILLLTFIDFRNENNLEYKEEACRKLYIELEKDINVLNVEPYKNLFDDTKFILNMMRHKNQIYSSLSIDDKLELANKGFYMFIHLYRTTEIKRMQQEISEFKQ